MQLDHVLIATPDLDAGARELHDRFGLATYDGGRHPWGTANRIAPLGDCYLELIAVVDDELASRTPLGGWVQAAATELLRPLGWVARVDDMDTLAQRLGLEPFDGSRQTTTGDMLRWRLAGVEDAVAEPFLPYFIEWGEGTPLPGGRPLTHPAGAVRLESVELRGDGQRLREWHGGEALPVHIAPGEPAVEGIVLATDDGQVTVGGP